MHSQHIRQTAYGPAADQMAVTVIDPLQPVEVQQEDCERTARSTRALDFSIHYVDQGAIVGKPSKSIGHGELANLIKKPGVIEQSSTQHEGVAGQFQQLCECE